MAPKKDTKKKATEVPAAEEPAAKKAKAEEEKKEEPKEEEKKVETPEDKEREKDAPNDSRRTISGKPVTFEPSDCSLNIVPTTMGNMMMPMSEGGMQYLIGGARASVGVKAGRYMFEVSIVEIMQQHEGPGKKGPWPKNLCRVGFSKAGSSLILGEGAGSVCFDAEGAFYSEGKKTGNSRIKFARDQVVGVLLNLDPKSPNANTISLFKSGVRMTDPMPLPEDLHGEALFPHVAFRNVSVQVNLGSKQMKPLPFACRMIQDAAEPDVKAAPAAKGKRTVVFPVAMPDEGAFDWADDFLEKNPRFVELSDRKVQEWAVKSGCHRGYGGKMTSNDKPAFNFGLHALDDGSASRVISAVAPCVPRDYFVMEMQDNLCPEKRKAALKKFSPSSFKRVAKVILGKPPAAIVKKACDVLLKEKQAKLTLEWNKRKALKEQQKLAAERRKKMEELKKQAAEERKRKVEEVKKRAAEAKAKQDAEKAAKGEAVEEKAEETKDEQTKDEEMKEETKPEETKEEETKEEAPEEPDEPEPVAELTEEEQATCFKRAGMSDMSAAALSASFGMWALPCEDEGFDEITFEWLKESEAKKHIKDFVSKLKITSRIDDLQPGEWFKTTLVEFRKLSKDWEGAANGEKKEGEAVLPPPVDTSVFVLEDWALHNLRMELYLLHCAYKKDVEDPERPGIHEDHILYYYSKYFKKNLNPASFGRKSVQEVLVLLKDSFALNDQGVMTLKIQEGQDASYLLAKQDENRRERQRRIEAGDETAKLEFTLLRQQKEAVEKAAAAKAAKALEAQQKAAAAKEAAEKRAAEAKAASEQKKAALAAAKAAAKAATQRPPLTPGGHPASMALSAKGAGKAPMAAGAVKGGWGMAAGMQAGLAKGMGKGKGMWGMM